MRLPPLSFTAIILAAILSAPSCHALPTTDIKETTQSTSGLNTTNTAASNNDCYFPGNPSLYGLGIRTGIYLTSLSTLLAAIYTQKAGPSLAKLSSLFQLAILVALVRETIANPGGFYAIEALVAYLLCLSSLPLGDVIFTHPVRGKPLSSTTTNWLERRTMPNLTGLLRQLVFLAVDGYQVWFWFLGVDRLGRLPCGTETFFLARVDVYGPFRVFAKIWSILTVVGVAMVMVMRLLDCPFQKGSEVPVYVKVGAVGFFMGMIVCAVELTLWWNDVTGVNDVAGAGQLIPLVVGLVTFVGMVLNWERDSQSS